MLGNKPFEINFVWLLLIIFSLCTVLISIINRNWVLLIPGVILVFLAVGILNFKNWARITVIVLMSITLFLMLSSISTVIFRARLSPKVLMKMIPGILLGLIIPILCIYLLSISKVKAQFRAKAKIGEREAQKKKGDGSIF